MFMVDEDTAASIRRAWYEDGELSSIIEFRRHFPLISDPEKARMCVQMIVGWKPPPSAEADKPADRATTRPARRKRTPTQ